MAYNKCMRICEYANGVERCIMKEEGITRVTIRVPSELYAKYKKVLIDKHTNTTYDLLQHIEETVQKYDEEITNRKEGCSYDE